MKKFLLTVFTTLVLCLLISSCANQAQKNTHNKVLQLSTSHTDACNSEADATQKQFIIGYGSLMQKESRLRTAPKAGKAYAVDVNGIQRGWFAKGASTGYSTTFLGAVIDTSSHINAVMFSLSIDELAAMDKRESSYCRAALSANQIQLSNGIAALPIGQYWIYLNPADSIAFASVQKPIVQSYVDIFLGGCLELEEQYQLSDFAKRCVNSTSEWSSHWVNDRIYPRRAFIHQPKAWHIDHLLNAELPLLFNSITIE
jgi:hypothetical protein